MYAFHGLDDTMCMPCVSGDEVMVGTLGGLSDINKELSGGVNYTAGAGPAETNWITAVFPSARMDRRNLRRGSSSTGSLRASNFEKPAHPRKSIQRMLVARITFSPARSDGLYVRPRCGALDIITMACHHSM